MAVATTNGFSGLPRAFLKTAANQSVEIATYLEALLGSLPDRTAQEASRVLLLGLQGYGVMSLPKNLWELFGEAIPRNMNKLMGGNLTAEKIVRFTKNIFHKTLPILRGVRAASRIGMNFLTKEASSIFSYVISSVQIAVNAVDVSLKCKRLISGVKRNVTKTALKLINSLASLVLNVYLLVMQLLGIVINPIAVAVIGGVKVLIGFGKDFFSIVHPGPDG